MPIPPPDREPGWILADTSFQADSVTSKHVLILSFRKATPQRDRNSALDGTGCHVIGGAPIHDGGYYFLWCPDDGSGLQIALIRKRLEHRPEITLVIPYLRSRDRYLGVSSPRLPAA